MIGIWWDAILTLLRTEGRYLVNRKFSLFLLTLEIALKELLIIRILKKQLASQRILEYNWLVGDYSIFSRIFIDIFLKSQYYFPLSKKAPYIIDCGSHVGLSVLYFKILYPQATIVAIEPNPEAFTLLKKNVRNNKLRNIRLINVAVSNKSGKKTFFFNPNIKTDWAGTIQPLNEKEIQKMGKILVKTYPISQIIKKRVDVLKIDIEGMEEKVINNLAKTGLIKKINLFIIEYHSCLSGGNKNSLSKILTLLENNRFSYSVNYFLRHKWVLRPPFVLHKYLAQNSNLLIYAQKERS